MRGCRPLTNTEVEQVLGAFVGRSAPRDRALFVLGLKAGFRVSELLSLRVGDIAHAGRIAVEEAARGVRGTRLVVALARNPAGDLTRHTRAREHPCCLSVTARAGGVRAQSERIASSISSCRRVRAPPP